MASTIFASAKCRFVGNMLEYSAANALAQRGGLPRNPYTRDKMQRWQTLYSNPTTMNENMMPTPNDFDRAYKHLKINYSMPIEYELSKDMPNDTTDIAIFNDNSVINISLKNNNDKLKHQRPKALYKQLQLDPDNANVFKQEYQQINDKYFHDWTNNGITLFKELPSEEKQSMYNDILDLTIAWLLRDPEYIRRYIRFVTNDHKANHILCWNPLDRQFTLIHKHVPSVLSSNINDYKVYKENTFLYISYPSAQFTLKIRIHNASSRITKTLQIKYDTTLMGMHYEVI